MKTASKLTITLSPEEVKEAIQTFILHRDEVPRSRQEVTFNFSEYACELSGATVEVTQP